jgi:hypothetical protein
MSARRAAATLFALLALHAPAPAQTVTLAEAPTPGECARYTVELVLGGQMTVTQEGGKQPIKLEARAGHAFTERTLLVDGGLPSKSARHYGSAGAVAIIAGDRIDRSLPADRALVVAQRSSDGLFCYSPAGPLTRDELDLVTEHFNPQCLAGLLPGKAVNVGDTWSVSNAAAQAACLFDGLVKNTLVGKLTAAKDSATFTIEGTAEGIEHGAKVSLTVSATGTFDPASKRVIALTWKQKDVREQGPVNPAAEVEATVTVKREFLAQPPKELADAALAVVPQGNPTPLMTHLRHADAKGRYQFVYPRDWHVTGQTDSHLVMRLLDRGEFIAQATVTGWKKAEAGKHTPVEEFKKAVGDSPGWIATRVIEDGELPTDGGRWIYRLVAEGKMENLPVVQAFHLIAGPQGDQAVVTFAMKPEQIKAVGTRDVGLVQAIEFPGKK